MTKIYINILVRIILKVISINNIKYLDSIKVVILLFKLIIQEKYEYLYAISERYNVF